MGEGRYTSQSNLLQQISRILPVDEYEVTHAYLRGETEGDGAEGHNNRVKYFNISRNHHRGLRLRATAHLEQYCRENGFDVAIGHGFRAVSMLLSVNRRRRFKLCIGVAHSVGRYDRLRRRLMMRLSIRGNCRFVGVSDMVTDYLLSLRAGFTPLNTRTINNAVDTDAMQQRLLERDAAREALGLPRQGFIFGTLGRLSPVKGHRTMLEAFRLISGSHPEAFLVFIGEGQLEGEYRRLTEQWGLQGRVFLLGTVPQASRYLRALDVFVMPSLSEGLSLALMEAMAASLPIIGSDAPSIIMLAGSVGEIFPRGDEQALSRSMEKLMSAGDDTLDGIGQRTLEHLRRNHSIETYRREFLDLIGSCRDT